MQISSTAQYSGILVERDTDGNLISSETESGIWVERDTIPEILSIEIRSVVQMYNRCRAFGGMGISFPYSGGWDEQPCHVIDIIESLLSIEKIREKERGNK